MDARHPLFLGLRFAADAVGLVSALRPRNTVTAIHITWPPDAPTRATPVALSVEVGLLVRETMLRISSVREGPEAFVAHLWHPVPGRSSRPRFSGWISLVLPAEVMPLPGEPLVIEAVPLVEQAYKGVEVASVEVSWPDPGAPAVAAREALRALAIPDSGSPLSRAEFLARRPVFLPVFQPAARRHAISVYLGDDEEEVFPIPREPRDPELRQRLQALLAPFEGRTDAPPWDETYSLIEALRAAPELVHGLYLESRENGK